MPDTTVRIRGPLIVSGLGVAGMALVGVGVGISVFYGTAGLLMNSGVIGLVVVNVLVHGVAFVLWLSHDRYARGLAVGLSGFWVGLFAWLLVTDPVAGSWRGPGMSAEDIATEKASILAGDKPAFYLGEEAEGHDLEWVYPDMGGSAKGFTFGYGSDCEVGDGGCVSDIYVRTFAPSRGYFRAYTSCTRVKPVLGVPAVALSDYSLVLFTGNSMIVISDIATENDSRGEMELAASLRPLGQSKAVTELPPPTAELGFVDQVCGPVR